MWTKISQSEAFSPREQHINLSIATGRFAAPAGASACPKIQTAVMTQKELVLDAINELPDKASFDDIAEHVKFLAAVQKALDRLDCGEGIPHQEVKHQLATWLSPAPSSSAFLRERLEICRRMPFIFCQPFLLVLDKQPYEQTELLGRWCHLGK